MTAPQSVPLDKLLREIRACTICAAVLPHSPRPIVVASADSRVLIIGQAPGARVHASGIPWSDASGARLRNWLGVSDETFYDASKFALVPMGFCFPGRGASGDLPPRPECAAHWHRALLAQLKEIRLTVVIGQYAQRYVLADGNGRSLTDTLLRWREYGPGVIPLPHPSPRNIAWFKRNPWFEADVLPTLRERVAQALLVQADTFLEWLETAQPQAHQTLMHPEAWTPPDYLTKSLDDPITRIPGPLDAHATNGRLDERIDSTALSARRQARRAPAG